MHLKLYLLGLCAISHMFFNLVNSAAMIGENVREAQLGEFPAVVSIMNINEVEEVEINQICTGVLLSREHVLTAAHCLKHVLVNETEVILGSRDLRCGRKHSLLWWVKYDQWISRRNTSPEFHVNDIAVLKLKEKAPDDIIPARVSTASNMRLYGMQVETAGWGITQTQENPRLLHTVTLRLLSNAQCELKLSRECMARIPIHERLLCSVAEPFALLLPGDSGAPIFFMNAVVAIHKSTAPYPDLIFHPKKINVHTSIDYYREFVLDVINSSEEWY